MPLMLEKYFDKIGIPAQFFVGLRPSVESLYFIVNKHVMAIPYQNFSLFFKEKPIDMSVSSLTERLVHQKQGGMCYEHSELLYHALLSLGFDVRRVPAFILNNKPFDASMPSAHNISIVLLEKKFFLIDVGFGYNSLRYPLALDLDKTQEISLFKNEQYQLVHADRYVQLNVLQNNNWFSLYRMKKPFEFIDFHNTESNYHTLLQFPGCMPIRDSYIKAGMITPQGRECFHFEPKKGTKPLAFRTTIVFGKENTRHYDRFVDFKKDLTATLGIQPLPGSQKLLEYEALEMGPRLWGTAKKFGASTKSKPAIIFTAGLGIGAFLYDAYSKMKP